MKLKPDFVDEFRSKRQKSSLPIRSIAQLMVVVALSGVALAIAAGKGKQNEKALSLPVRARRFVQGPQVKALAAPPRDRFVVMAATEIDAKMVVLAPATIDEAMVYNPYIGQDGSDSSLTAQADPLVPLPGNQPDQHPEISEPPRYLVPRAPR